MLVHPQSLTSPSVHLPVNRPLHPDSVQAPLLKVSHLVLGVGGGLGGGAGQDVTGSPTSGGMSIFKSLRSLPGHLEIDESGY